MASGAGCNPGDEALQLLAQFGFLSHFHPSPIVLDGERWPTVEHFYQAQKSPDPDYRAAIREAIHPGRAKSLAAQPMAPRWLQDMLEGGRTAYARPADRERQRQFLRIAAGLEDPSAADALR